MKFRRISGLLLTFALIAPVTLTGCYERDVVIEEQEEDIPVITPERESDININQWPESDINDRTNIQPELDNRDLQPEMNTPDN